MKRIAQALGGKIGNLRQIANLSYSCLRHRRWALWVTAAAMLALAAIVLLWPMDTRLYLGARSSGEMVDRNGRLLYAFTNEEEQWCFPRELSEFSPRLIQATIATEDQRFWRHPGIDPIAGVRALGQNLWHGRVVSGASTLTMQVAKRSAPRPAKGLSGSTRSLASKIAQVARAVRLELRAGKNDILRAYLNNAPYGQNLIGAEAAARRYFGKPASELTLAEAALLAGLPRSPTALSPFNHPGPAMRRRGYALDRMRAEGYITDEEWRRAQAAALGVSRNAFPTLAPHLAMNLRPEIRAKGRVVTTLDGAIQAQAERLVKEGVAGFGGEITNGAAIVIDVASATVLARVGSAAFFSTPGGAATGGAATGGGQVDASRAPRSPGSTLKPFIYALAMERNQLYACETLVDAPLDYGLFAPENFDRRYRGLVSAGEALKDSLNVPAIIVLDRAGYENAWAFLRQIGLTTLTEAPEHYGLGLTLGSCDARLDELAGAYCMLANLGEVREVQEVVHSVHSVHEVIRAGAGACLSRGTCLKVFEMLERPLPEEVDPDEAPLADPKPRVCWKTGTSNGYHDAWTFVFNRQYVVGVWMGNNDGRPSGRLVGGVAAAPLAARIFRSLQPGNEPAWPSPGEDLRPVTVCALSGLPVSSWCPRARTEWLPRGQFVNRLCDVHYPAPGIGGAEGDSARVMVRWPGAARGWDLAHAPAASASILFPPSITSSTALASSNGSLKRESGAPARKTVESLRILNPSEKAEFILTGEPAGDLVRLSASVDGETPLHWYMNERYLGDSAPGKPLMLRLSLGEHKLACMTPAGETDQINFRVAAPDSSLVFKNP